MRNRAILIVVMLVCIASVAYASFATNVTVNGTGTATGNWDVTVISIAASGQVGATDHVSTPTFNATSATFNVDLAYPGATSSYLVSIKNNGNISAKVSSITDLTAINAGAPTYLTYTMTGIATNDILAPGATDVATVTVTWDASATTNPAGASKAATITFNYVQNT